jgi:hypothetical protein
MCNLVFTQCRIEARVDNIKCSIIGCSHYLSCSRIQRRPTDWRPTLVIDQVVRLGRHFRAVRSIGPGAMLTVPASNHLPDTTSATGDVTVPDVTWWVCLIRCTVAQADNKKNRKKEPHPCIYHRSGNVGFCAVLTPVCKLSERPARVFSNLLDRRERSVGVWRLGPVVI